MAAALALAVSFPGPASATDNWVLQPVPLPTGISYGALVGISCVSAASCTAVGNIDNTAGPYAPLADSWDGSTWTAESVPLPAGAGVGFANGVSCASADSCTLVGQSVTSTSPTVESPLAEHWDGSAWTIQTVPVPPGSAPYGIQLNAVSCASPANCTAVGEYDNKRTGHTIALAEHWNGSTWKIRKTPSLGTAAGLLFAVSCVSGSNCTAVGASVTSTDSPLAEHWNGSVWEIQQTPTVLGAGFSGVSCPSPSHCTAVGHASATGGALAAGWDGSTWTVQPTPDLSGYLNGVSCVSRVNCTAVGGSLTNSPLAEHWNGKKWLGERTAPGTGFRSNGLSGVSCLTGGFCSASGTHFQRKEGPTPIDETENR